jgi:hypothetical protein
MATDTSASTKPAAPRLKLPAAMAGSLPLDASPVSSRSASRLQPSRPAPPPSPHRSGTWWPGGGPSLGAGRGALAPGASQDGQARSPIFCTSTKAPSLHLLLWHSCRHGRRCPRPFLGRARPYLRSESTHCSAWFEIEEGRTMVVSSAPGQRPWRKVAVLDTRLCGPGSGPCD